MLAGYIFVTILLLAGNFLLLGAGGIGTAVTIVLAMAVMYKIDCLREEIREMKQKNEEKEE